MTKSSHPACTHPPPNMRLTRGIEERGRQLAQAVAVQCFHSKDLPRGVLHSPHAGPTTRGEERLLLLLLLVGGGRRQGLGLTSRVQAWVTTGISYLERCNGDCVLRGRGLCRAPALCHSVRCMLSREAPRFLASGSKDDTCSQPGARRYLPSEGSLNNH